MAPTPWGRGTRESRNQSPPSSMPLDPLGRWDSEMGPLSKGIFKPSRIMSRTGRKIKSCVFLFIGWLIAAFQSLLASLGHLDCQGLWPALEPPGAPSSPSAPSAWSRQPPLTPPLPPLQDSGPRSTWLLRAQALSPSAPVFNRGVNLRTGASWGQTQKEPGAPGTRAGTSSQVLVDGWGRTLSGQAAEDKACPGTTLGPGGPSGVSPTRALPPPPRQA